MALAGARTVSDALAERGPGTALPALRSGSRIEASFRIWIGDPVKNEAWARLGRARARMAEVERDRPGYAGLAEARRLLHAAEGSNWFW